MTPENMCVTPWGLFYHILIGYDGENICFNYLNSTVVIDPVGALTYIKYFLTTLFLEFPIYYWLLRNQTLILSKNLGQRLPQSFLRFNQLRKIIVTSILINLATHPIVFFVFPYMSGKGDWTFTTYLLVAEVFAPIVEAVILKFLFKLPVQKAAMAAILANLFSWTVGVLLLH